jgi:hypothetical protein
LSVLPTYAGNDKKRMTRRRDDEYDQEKENQGEQEGKIWEL